MPTKEKKWRKKLATRLRLFLQVNAKHQMTKNIPQKNNNNKKNNHNKEREIEWERVRESKRGRVKWEWERAKKSQISNLLCGNIEIHILSLPLAEKLKNSQVQHGFDYQKKRTCGKPKPSKRRATRVSQLQSFCSENMFKLLILNVCTRCVCVCFPHAPCKKASTFSMKLCVKHEFYLLFASISRVHSNCAIPW